MKNLSKESVLHDWLQELPFTQQAVLLLALRGPDGLPKENAAKELLHFIRHCVLKPAYPYDRQFAFDGFMRGDFENFNDVEERFFKDVDMLPHHFLMHIIHACQIIGWHYHDDDNMSQYIQQYFQSFYLRACDSFHMNPESFSQLQTRLKK